MNYTIYDNQTQSTSEQNELFFEMVASITLTSIIVPTNFLIFIIITRAKFRNISLFRYILFEILLNTSIEIIVWAAFFIDTVTNYLEKNFGSCKLYLYITFVFTTWNAWNYVLIFIDNYFLVKFPTQFRIRKTLKFQITNFFSLLLFSCLLNMQHFEYGMCRLVKDIQSFRQVLYFTIIEVILPFSLRFLFAILTFRERVVTRMRANPTNINLRNDKKVFIVMSALNLCFLGFNLPYCIALLIDTYDHKYSVNNWILDAFILLRFIYFYLEILLFCISNRLFREFVYTWFENINFLKKKKNRRGTQVKKKFQNLILSKLNH